MHPVISDLLRRGRLRLRLGCQHLERQLARLGIGGELHRVTVRDGLREERACERRLKLTLHDALEGPRAVLRVIPG